MAGRGPNCQSGQSLLGCPRAGSAFASLGMHSCQGDAHMRRPVWVILLGLQGWTLCIVNIALFASGAIRPLAVKVRVMTQMCVMCCVCVVSGVSCLCVLVT